MLGEGYQAPANGDHVGEEVESEGSFDYSRATEKRCNGA